MIEKKSKLDLVTRVVIYFAALCAIIAGSMLLFGTAVGIMGPLLIPASIPWIITTKVVGLGGIVSGIHTLVDTIVPKEKAVQLAA